MTDPAGSRWLKSSAAPACHAPPRTGCSNGWRNCAGSAATDATTSWGCGWSSWDRSQCIRTGCTSAAQPFLHELHRATGLVVHLAVLDGSDVVYLEKIAGGLGAAIPTRVGGRQPAHCTAVGKALLAFSDPRQA